MIHPHLDVISWSGTQGQNSVVTPSISQHLDNLKGGENIYPPIDASNHGKFKLNNSASQLIEAMGTKFATNGL